VAVLNFLQLIYAIQKKIDLGSTGEWLSFFARVMLATFACGCIVLFGDECLLHSHDSFPSWCGHPFL